jgi:hypothetical protein
VEEISSATNQQASRWLALFKITRVLNVKFEKNPYENSNNKQISRNREFRHFRRCLRT